MREHEGMESQIDVSYSCEVDTTDYASAFPIAPELIAQHGDNVATFLQDKIAVHWFTSVVNTPDAKLSDNPFVLMATSVLPFRRAPRRA